MSSFRVNIIPHLRLRKIMTWPRRTFLLTSLCVVISNRFYGFEFFKFIFKFTSLCDSKVCNLQFRADNSYFCDSQNSVLFCFSSSHCEVTCLLPGDRRDFSWSRFTLMKQLQRVTTCPFEVHPGSPKENESDHLLMNLQAWWKSFQLFPCDAAPEVSGI